jgi:hypothetical protein
MISQPLAYARGTVPASHFSKPHSAALMKERSFALAFASDTSS